jgi:hypothetical protein
MNRFPLALTIRPRAAAVKRLGSALAMICRCEPLTDRSSRGFAPPAYKRLPICYCWMAPNLFNRAQREIAMAKGQMRSNKEKKKPKADKNLKKGGAAPSPFASGKTPAGQSPNSKKN